ncbi:MAG TPA: hypothetical protein VIW25_00970 [Nitrososphaeraceae archaeon]
MAFSKIEKWSARCDVYEQEADRVAEQVMRMSSYTINKKPSAVFNSLKVLHNDAVEPPIQFSKKSNTNNMQNVVSPASVFQKAGLFPRTFIHCTPGPFSSWTEPFTARTSKPEWSVHTTTTGHDIMIAHPKDLQETFLHYV